MYLTVAAGGEAAGGRRVFRFEVCGVERVEREREGERGGGSGRGRGRGRERVERERGREGERGRGREKVLFLVVRSGGNRKSDQ